MVLGNHVREEGLREVEVGERVEGEDLLQRGRRGGEKGAVVGDAGVENEDCGRAMGAG